jgi:hypothetical protein
MAESTIDFIIESKVRDILSEQRLLREEMRQPGGARMMPNIKRGAFRLWVFVAALWVGLVGFSWSGTFAGAWREGCFHDDGVSWARGARQTGSGTATWRSE